MVILIDVLDKILDEFRSTTLFSALGITEEEQESFDFLEMQEYYFDKPCEFMEDFLGLIADDKQRDVAESVRDHKRTAVRSGQGVGKTAIVSGIVIWYLCTRYQAKIIATAPNMAQLNTVLWAEIAKWLEGSPLSNFITHTKTRLYMNGYEKSWFAFPKTANSKEGMAGQHADHLLIICDEASGILDEILETLLGTISGPMNKILLISNPTRASGTYYNAFHQDRAMYNCIHIDSETVARVDLENIEMLAKSYGIDSNVYRVRVKGDFPKQEEDAIMSLDLIESTIAREWINLDTGVIKIGVDVARFGSDSTVIVPNVKGNIIGILERRGQDLMRTAGDCLNLANQLRSKYTFDKKAAKRPAFYYDAPPIVVLVIDDTGLGGGVTDRLNEVKREQALDWLVIIPVNAASRVHDVYYSDITTKLWFTIKELMEQKKLKICSAAQGNKKENDMIGQLTTRKYFMQSDGKNKVESKKEMKKRGLKSPDIGDALALSCYPINEKVLLSGGRDSTRPSK